MTPSTKEEFVENIQIHAAMLDRHNMREKGMKKIFVKKINSSPDRVYRPKDSIWGSLK